MHETVDPVFMLAQFAIVIMQTHLETETDQTHLQEAAVEFEDAMNKLSGDILNLVPALQLTIQTANQGIINDAANANVTVTLYESLIPKASRTEEVIVYQTGKKLYPLTTSVPVGVSGNGAQSSLSDIQISSVSGQSTPSLLISEEEDVIDEIFDELDDEAVDEVPLAAEQNETVEMLSNGMIELSKIVAANANGLQAGLTTFSYNPLGSLIDNTRALLLYYTYGNYANLNVALSGIYSDNALATQYKTLREAIGGPDGLSGAVTQLDIFKDHTDRLSGLVLDSDSPNSEETGDSTDEFLNLNDFSGGPTVIFDFDARKFRSAKYMIQATAAEADRGHQITEIYILHDNYHAYTREVASVYSQDPFVSYTTQFLNSRVRVLANTAASNTDFVIHGTRLRIARVAESYDEMSQMKIIENHEILATYLDDGIDYVQLQSESLLHPETIANLGREFRDMLADLSTYEFSLLSTGAKQAVILGWADDIKARRVEIQTSIDTDYNNFLYVRKLAEALDIASLLTQAYTDENGNAIPKTTLNNATILAIEEDL
jgi:hypothetical protein